MDCKVVGMAQNTHMQEPTALEFALHERYAVTGFGAIGPLTLDQQVAEDSYQRYMQEAEAEEEARVAAGGRTLCPNCGQRTLVHTTVCTLGYPGHPGTEFSDYGVCENCNHKEL